MFVFSANLSMKTFLFFKGKICEWEGVIPSSLPHPSSLSTISEVNHFYSAFLPHFSLFSKCNLKYKSVSLKSGVRGHLPAAESEWKATSLLTRTRALSRALCSSSCSYSESQDGRPPAPWDCTIGWIFFSWFLILFKFLFLWYFFSEFTAFFFRYFKILSVRRTETPQERQRERRGRWPGWRSEGRRRVFGWVYRERWRKQKGSYWKNITQALALTTYMRTHIQSYTHVFIHIPAHAHIHIQTHTPRCDSWLIDRMEMKAAYPLKERKWESFIFTRFFHVFRIQWPSSSNTHSHFSSLIM